MRKAPNMPFGTEICECRWAWYMPIDGRSAVNSYVKVSPVLTGSWVNGDTPSCEFGVGMPCQWMSVPIGVLLVSSTCTLSPTSTMIWGPGI